MYRFPNTAKPVTIGHMFCIGHRGAAGLAPQNTLSAVNAAIASGCKWVEIDVWNVEDTPVVFHDRRLERLTGSAGLLSTLSLKELKNLRVQGSEEIPLLRDLLLNFVGRVGINIELKGPNTAKSVSRILRTTGISKDKILISSFDHNQIREIRDLEPDLRRAIIVHGYPDGFIEFAKEIDATSIHLHADFIDLQHVEAIHQAGMKAFAYTINLEDDARIMQQLGIDAVFSDYPDRIVSFCGAAGARESELF